MPKLLKIILSIVLAIGLVFAGLVAYLIYSPYDYYEYSADNASQCSKGEEWDEEYKICSFDYECISDEECAEVDKKYAMILNNLASKFSPDKTANHGKLSSVDNDILSSDADQTEKIRQMLRALLPQEYFDKVSNITMESDGEYGLLAYVYPVEGSGGKFWGVGYDAVDAFTTESKLKNPEELLKTIVHEFAHILSLNDKQVTHRTESEAETSCPTNEILIDQGCIKEGAYINEFSTLFWTKELQEEASKASEDGTYDEFSTKLYESAPESFVSEYAATSMVEDFAESFTDFIMKNERHDQLISDQKVEYFYKFPELLALRKRMRGGLYKILIQSNI